MKKSLWIMLVIMALALGSLPFALLRIRSGREDISIAEETLWGDPEAAQGVTLQIASHWDRRLLWNTKYKVGSGKSESTFRFSSGQVSWKANSQKAVGILFGSQNTILAAAGYTQPDNQMFSELFRAVEERTGDGESNRETIRIGDYYMFYPIQLAIEGSSVIYDGDYGEVCEYLTDFFHIQTKEDAMEVWVEKDPAGYVSSMASQISEEGKSFTISNISAFAENGAYYTYCLENVHTGEEVDRGQNRGIFFFPYVERHEILQLDAAQVRKVCELPENAAPRQMLLDEEREILYLAADTGKSNSLFVYTLEGETPVLTQEIPVGREERLFANGDARLNGMVFAEGGVLILWSNRCFSFVTAEDGMCRWWCDGEFPDVHKDNIWWDNIRRDDIFLDMGDGTEPFFEERVCIFDGERLILAAFAERCSLDVILAVYREDGPAYCGLFRYPKGCGVGEDALYDIRYRILPQGIDWQMVYSDFAYQQGKVDGNALEITVE